MEKHSLINRSALDYSELDYGSLATSLMREASRVGLWDDKQSEALENGLLTELSEQITAVTHGESSSIPDSLADQLMDGIGYCVDYALRSVPTPEAALELLKNNSAHQLYTTGKDLLDAHAKASEALLSRVRATRTDTVNEGYRIMLDETLPGLIRAWKSNPCPRDFAVITEYPLAKDFMLDGIAGVHARLSALALENRFCARFSGVLSELLEDYARQNRVSPADSYVNLFTLALGGSIFCRLLGHDGASLDRDELSELETRVLPLADEQRAQLVLRAAELLLADCAFENEKLEGYVLDAAKDLAVSLNAVKGHVTTIAAPRSGARPVFVSPDGAGLGNDAFSVVADELRLTDSPDGKAQILRDELRSLDDLCDMLSEGCIGEEDFDTVFAALGDETCALLLSRVGYDIPPENGALPLPRDDAPEWQPQLTAYLSELGVKRLAKILDLGSTLAEEY